MLTIFLIDILKNDYWHKKHNTNRRQRKANVKTSQCDLTEKILAGDVLNHSNVWIRMGTESRENQSRGLKGEIYFKKKRMQKSNQQSKSHQWTMCTFQNFQLQYIAIVTLFLSEFVDCIGGRGGGDAVTDPPPELPPDLVR